MQKSNYRNKRQSSSVVSLAPKVAPRLRLGGFQPPAGMVAGEYIVHCDSALKKPWHRGWRIELKFRVVDGDFMGVALAQWIPVDPSGVISPESRYAKQCAIALGCPLAEANVDLDNPARIFAGRNFRALIAFRKTDKPRGGTSSAENMLRRKDDNDGLRVHELRERVSL